MMNRSAHALRAPTEAAARRETLDYGRSIIQQASAALADLSAQLDDHFCRSVDHCASCRGSVVVSGMGKAGLVGQKVSATFASTGTRSHFLHPAEAVHGDLGRVGVNDVVLMISQSGETQEVLQLLPSVVELQIPLLAMTGRSHSRLAQAATEVLDIGELQEACRLGLAPSTSTTAMIALGDALALATSACRNFTAADFARFHPGGSLGLQLARVEEHMRPLSACRVARLDQTVREVLVAVGRPQRRSGAVLLVNHQGHLRGIFTDSDLARLLENERDSMLDQPIARVMTDSPRSVRQGTMMTEALSQLSQLKISELPVVDEHDCPLGLLDVTDMIALLPSAAWPLSDKAPDEADAYEEGPAPQILPLRTPPHDHS